MASRKTRRIYYGPPGHETEMWWDVKVSRARKEVMINGNVFHALKGHAGVTIGCGLSNMAADKSNARSFPHPVFLASFNKTTCLLVDKLKKNGSPEHAVLYDHSYGHITDRNDAGTLKKLVQEDPSIVERSFTLRPPRNRKTLSRWPENGVATGERKSGKSFVPRGALARAEKAGRIGKHVAEQLAEVADA